MIHKTLMRERESLRDKRRMQESIMLLLYILFVDPETTLLFGLLFKAYVISLRKEKARYQKMFS